MSKKNKQPPPRVMPLCCDEDFGVIHTSLTKHAATHPDLTLRAACVAALARMMSVTEDINKLRAFMHELAPIFAKHQATVSAQGYEEPRALFEIAGNAVYCSQQWGIDCASLGQGGWEYMGEWDHPKLFFARQLYGAIESVGYSDQMPLSAVVKELSGVA